MSKQISIQLPENLAEQELSQFLMENWQQYRHALDQSGDYFDRRSQLDKIAIAAVEVELTQVVVRYVVEYSGFQPCKDIHYNATEQRMVIGIRHGRTVIFYPYQPLDERSTCDEL